MTDKILQRLTAVAVILVATIAAVISFIHIYSLAVTHHQIQVAALLLPLSIDGVVAAMSATLLRAARSPDMKAPWYAHGMLYLSIFATLAANFGYGEPHGFISAAISCWPAIAFIGCVEVAVKMAENTTAAKPVVKPKAVSMAPAQIITVDSPSSNGHVKKPAKTVRKSRAASPSKPVITVELAERIAAERGCSARTVYRHPEWAMENAAK